MGHLEQHLFSKGEKNWKKVYQRDRQLVKLESLWYLQVNRSNFVCKNNVKAGQDCRCCEVYTAFWNKFVTSKCVSWTFLGRNKGLWGNGIPPLICETSAITFLVAVIKALVFSSQTCSGDVITSWLVLMEVIEGLNTFQSFGKILNYGSW